MDTQELGLTILAEEVCRTCLAAVDGTQLKPIFCNEILDCRIVPFPSVLELVTGEKLVKNDKLPNHVCAECKGKLRDLYLFVGMAKKSSKLMYEIFAVEPPKPAVTSSVPVTKHAQVQTEETTFPALETIDTHRSKSMVIRADARKQSENECFAPKTTTTSCQTDGRFELEEGIVVDTAQQIIKIDDGTMTPTDDDDDRVSGHEHDLLDDNSIDNPLLNFDDENEYEMILLENAANEDKRFTMPCIEPTEQKQTITESSSKKEPTILNHGILVSKKPTKQDSRKRSSLDVRSDLCTYCNLQGSSAYLEHHFQVHKETLEMCLESTDYYRCADCFMVFTSETHFAEHTCHREELGEDVRYHPELSKHEAFYRKGMDICVPRLKTFRKIGNRYQCGRCVKYKSISFEKMRQHCVTHEEEDEKIVDVNVLWKNSLLYERHICGICKGLFPDATYIRQHLYFHQDSYICVYDCGMIFVSFLRMTRHFEQKHLQIAHEVAELAESADPADATQQIEQNTNYSCKTC
uniref:ZAD domain-containing protein n=1 Tax=Anopheles epiroticus TaxID=199890 RepID=A0A182PUG4_9DIPT